MLNLFVSGLSLVSFYAAGPLIHLERQGEICSTAYMKLIVGGSFPNMYVGPQPAGSHSVRLGPYSSISTTFTASGIAWVTKCQKIYFTYKSVEFLC